MEEKELKAKPKASNSYGQRELDKAEKQFEQFDEQVKAMTLDHMNKAPKLEEEQQTKMSNREAQQAKQIYLKPEKTISVNQTFNEKFRESYNFDKEYVQFIAENNEIIGEAIEIWTRPYGGMPAEFWKVPTNKPVWGPRYLAEQIKSRSYHRLRTENNVMTGSNTAGQMYGGLIVDHTIQRLNAIPVSSRKSTFMGSTSF